MDVSDYYQNVRKYSFDPDSEENPEIRKGRRSRYNSEVIPTVTFTEPEISVEIPPEEEEPKVKPPKDRRKLSVQIAQLFQRRKSSNSHLIDYRRGSDLPIPQTPRRHSAFEPGTSTPTQRRNSTFEYLSDATGL